MNVFGGGINYLNHMKMVPNFYENEFCYYWISTSAYFSNSDTTYYYAWYVAFGYAVDNEGNNTHGAGAVRFSAKYEDSSATSEGGDNFMNSVRCVRTIE